MPYEGPPIKLRRMPGGGFKIQTQGGGIKVGGHNLAMAAGNNNGCYNNVQCQDANDERYSCVAPDGGPCLPGKSGCTCKCTDNSDPGWLCDETPTPTPTATATPTPTPSGPTSTPMTPTPSTPPPTPGGGAWCNIVKSSCDGNFYRTGGCSSGTYEDWTAANANESAGNLQFGKTCAEISCPPEATPICITPTPPPTPTYANFINKDNILDVYGINQ